MFENLLVIFWLVVLEGLLSVDNALVLALMVSVLPPEKRGRALKYGMWGAFIFRAIAVLLAVWLVKIWWIKIIGGAYLFYVAWKGLRDQHETAKSGKAPMAVPGFWTVVVQVELMDIAFSVDSILAAVALSENTLIVIIGGILGIVAMRFAAQGFTKLIERLPILKKTAYVLVVLIGAKLVASAWWHPPNWLFFGLLFAILGGPLILEKFKSRQ